MIHELKTWPEYFKEVVRGAKNFEVRKDDRNFSIGDTLILREWNPSTENYTGVITNKKITYIMSGGRFGIEEGYVILSLR